MQSVGCQGLQDAAVVVGMAVTHDQGLRDRVTERADPDLQGAAVGDQAGGVQTDRVVGRADLVVGRAEQGVGADRVRHHHIVEVGLDLRAIWHEGHLAVDDADLQQGFTGLAHAFDHLADHVGVAGQTQAQVLALALGGHRLGDHVHALHRHVPRHEGVVGGDVVVLGGLVADVVPGLHEELAHLDVRRQRMGAQVHGVLQIGIVGEDAFDQRLQEVLFQVALALGPDQRQRGDDAQFACRVLLDAPVQRIHERIGLADGQRNAQNDVTGDGVKYVVDGRFDRIDEQRLAHGLVSSHNG